MNEKAKLLASLFAFAIVTALAAAVVQFIIRAGMTSEAVDIRIYAEDDLPPWQVSEVIEEARRITKEATE